MTEGAPKTGLFRRLVHRLAQFFFGPVLRRQGRILEAVRSLHGDLGRVHREVEETTHRVRAIEADARRAAGIARHTFDRETENRRRLHELRQSEEYELAFSEEEPLVSFLIPTYTSHETLRDVALPSILNQTYSNIEVIVVGDAAPPETAEAIAQLNDPRVRYWNRDYRGPYPEDHSKRWYVIGTPPFNEALSQARGRWIAALGDDDAVRPTHTERLLAAARERRWEHCYGLQLVNFTEGEPMTLGKFPPELGEWGLQAAIYHAGLRFVESELSDAIYEEPNDWSMCRRMLRIGVRTGMLDEVVVDKYETRRSDSEAWKSGRVPQVD
ncbi:MAG TPA: glycosyltransferase family A protein [Solirubrobacterales bacterium]|nr:glycosyltransferase family A protein [Solirubrobacterales bacterium]